MGGSFASPFCSNSTFDINNVNTKTFEHGFRVATISNPNNLNNFVDVGDKYNISEINDIPSSYPFSKLSYPGNGIYEIGVSTDILTKPGKVNYNYKISRYPVTNAEYAEFLNAVAKSDPPQLFWARNYNLWEPGMGSSVRGGISRSGTSGSYAYKVKNNMGNKPVNFISIFSALRYINWLHNNKPSGPQNSNTTEDGAYNMQGWYNQLPGRNANFLIGLEPEILSLSTTNGSGALFNFTLNAYNEGIDTWGIDSVSINASGADNNYKYGELININTSNDTFIYRPARIGIITRKETPELKITGNATVSVGTDINCPSAVWSCSGNDPKIQPSYTIKNINVLDGGSNYTEGQTLLAIGLTPKDTIESDATLIAHTKKVRPIVSKAYVYPNPQPYIGASGSGAIFDFTLEEVQYKGLYNPNVSYTKGSVVYITGSYWYGAGFQNFYRKINGSSIAGEQPASPSYDNYGRLNGWTANSGWVSFDSPSGQLFGSRWIVTDINIVDGGENYSLTVENYNPAYCVNCIRLQVSDGITYGDFVAKITEVDNCGVGGITAVEILSSGSYAKDTDILEHVQIVDNNGGSYFKDSGSLLFPQKIKPELELNNLLTVDAVVSIDTFTNGDNNYSISPYGNDALINIYE
ncbi:hypothetical protein EB077_10805, partial [bacterium]|nr:hypothetical protein [bacterium]